MSDRGAKWDEPGNELSSKLDQVGDLARAYNLSVDRARMLIGRLGHDPERLRAEAERLSVKHVKSALQPKGPGLFVV